LGKSPELFDDFMRDGERGTAPVENPAPRLMPTSERKKKRKPGRQPGPDSKFLRRTSFILDVRHLSLLDNDAYFPGIPRSRSKRLRLCMDMFIELVKDYPDFSYSKHQGGFRAGSRRK